METTGGRVGAVTRHPFAAAIANRDHRALLDTLAADVVLHSAVTEALSRGARPWVSSMPA
jgi:hypothetical protein